jgi:hypothetical protein
MLSPASSQGFNKVWKKKRASDSFRVIGRPGSPPLELRTGNVSPAQILVNGTSGLSSPTNVLNAANRWGNSKKLQCDPRH